MLKSIYKPSGLGGKSGRSGSFARWAAICRSSFRTILPALGALALLAVGINAGHAQSGDPCDQINNPLNQFFQQNNPQFKKRQQDCAKLKTLQTERGA